MRKNIDELSHDVSYEYSLPIVHNKETALMWIAETAQADFLETKSIYFADNTERNDENSQSDEISSITTSKQEFVQTYKDRYMDAVSIIARYSGVLVVIGVGMKDFTISVTYNKNREPDIAGLEEKLGLLN